MRPKVPSDPPLLHVELPGGKIAYSDEGEGRVLVLVHGMPGSGRDFRWLAPALTPHARVIRVDMPGFGSSPVGNHGWRIDQRAAVVDRFLEALSLDDVVVLGHSMGGPVVIAAANTSSRIVAVGLLASVGPTPHRPIRSAPGVLWAGWTFQIPGVARLCLPLLRRLFAATGFRDTPDGEIVQTLMVLSRFRFARHRANLAACRRPCLVAWCEDDRVVDPDLGEKLYWASPVGPRLRFPTGGHNLQATRATELSETLLQWIEQV